MEWWIYEENSRRVRRQYDLRRRREEVLDERERQRRDHDS